MALMHMSVRTGSRWRAPDSERGSAAVEMVMLFPVAVLLLLVAVQGALWAVASQAVQVSASVGDEVARAYGSSLSAGTAQAVATLSAKASGLVENANVSGSTLPGDVVEVTVTGRAESILPGLAFPVSARRVGPAQGFRMSG